MSIFYTLLFIVLTVLILTHSPISMTFAMHAMTLWYSKMVPSLLPFMILSGIMIRMNLTENCVKLIHPLFRLLFRCRKNLSYGILTGFLCGFPMGARVTAELYNSGKITKREADYLLAFCNNIGPVYFCSFVLPLLGLRLTLPYLFGMYGLPMLYGILLRCTAYRDIPEKESSITGKERQKSALLDVLDDAVHTSIESIIMLCGYMILFNLLNIIPHFVLPAYSSYAAPLLEITGGLGLLGRSAPLYSLLTLAFGGMSCIAQTYHMIQNTDLSLKSYVRHRMLLTAITGVYYLLWYLLFPSLFLL